PEPFWTEDVHPFPDVGWVARGLLAKSTLDYLLKFFTAPRKHFWLTDAEALDVLREAGLSHLWSRSPPHPTVEVPADPQPAPLPPAPLEVPAARPPPPAPRAVPPEARPPPPPARPAAPGAEAPRTPQPDKPPPRPKASGPDPLTLDDRAVALYTRWMKEGRP